jgi:excisionase family DNA binding protein
MLAGRIGTKTWKMATAAGEIIIPNGENMKTILLDLHEVAKALKCSYEHARSLCAKGKLPFVDLGTGSRTVYRVRECDLDDFMNDAKRHSVKVELANVRTTLAAFRNVGRW